MSTVLEATGFCANQYRCYLDIYSMTVLSYLYGIIMDLAINAPGHSGTFVRGINATDKHYLKNQMESLDKLPSKD